MSVMRVVEFDALIRDVRHREERQLLMGHEHVTTTQRYYGHLTIEDVARKIEEVGL